MTTSCTLAYLRALVAVHSIRLLRIFYSEPLLYRNDTLRTRCGASKWRRTRYCIMYHIVHKAMPPSLTVFQRLITYHNSLLFVSMFTCDSIILIAVQESLNQNVTMKCTNRCVRERPHSEQP